MSKYYLLFFLLPTLFSCSNPMDDIENNSEHYAIIPKVSELEVMKGLFTLDDNVYIEADEQLEREADHCKTLLRSFNDRIAIKEKGDKVIRLEIDQEIEGDEAYILEVSSSEVRIRSNTAKGVFYGIQSLFQLIQEREIGDARFLGLAACRIKDAPVYTYRGMHLDVCRHFFSVDFVKRYIDILALHKLNTFHWHLTEDQGWRIEIKQYPKLTSVGGYRNGTITGNYPGTGNDNTVHGGYYTQEEVKDIIQYASERHIQVIPEIELPGHSSAAIAAYPFLSCFPEEASTLADDHVSEKSKAAQKSGTPKFVQESWGVYNDVYCVGKEETFEFLENVLTEVMDLFPSELIHIGGDECPKANWKRSPESQELLKEMGLKDEHELQSYFIKRIERFVNGKGKRIIGWDEILEGGLAPNASVMSWRGTSGGISAANAGHNVVMSPTSHCYFDYYQSEDRENEPKAIGGFLPVKKVYSFDPMPAELDSAKQVFILGGQANLWTEYIASEAQAEYMLLPRMTALSEALWTESSSKDWEDFKQRLHHMRSLYDQRSYNYATHVFDK